MFDQLGGLKRIVNGKTVAIKSIARDRPAYRLRGTCHWAIRHYNEPPQVLTATVHLMGKAGAKRIRIVEKPMVVSIPAEESLLQADWDPRQNRKRRVECGSLRTQTSLEAARGTCVWLCPFGGYLFPAYELNHSYSDCDAFVSLTKMKEHETTGFTASMKNCFGITPCSIYGGNAGVDEPNEDPKGGRGYTARGGKRQPFEDCARGINPTSPARRLSGCRRAVVDLIAARPVDLGNCDE